MLTQFVLRVLRRIRVETDEHLLVPEWVLLLHHRALRNPAALDRPQHGLDLRAVNQLAEIRLLDDCGWEQEVLLEL